MTCEKPLLDPGEALYTGRTCVPEEKGAHAGADLLSGFVTPTREAMLEQCIPEGLHP